MTTLEKFEKNLEGACKMVIKEFFTKEVVYNGWTKICSNGSNTYVLLAKDTSHDNIEFQYATIKISVYVDSSLGLVKFTNSCGQRESTSFNYSKQALAMEIAHAL